MLCFSDQLGQHSTLNYQFGVKGCNVKGREIWMESDGSRVEVECCSEAYIRFVFHHMVFKFPLGFLLFHVS